MTREPEWDDFERAKMQALAQYNREVCSCGLHPSIADTDPDLEITTRICPVCAGLEQQKRVLAAQDEAKTKALGEKPPASAPRPDDGRHLGLRAKPPKGDAGVP